MRFLIIKTLLIIFCTQTIVFGQFTKIFDRNMEEILINNRDLMIFPLQGISAVNDKGDVLWTKNLIDTINNKIVPFATVGMHIDDDGNFTLQSKFYINRINTFGISLLNETGDVEWSKMIQLDFAAEQFNRAYLTNAFIFDNEYYFIGEYFIEEQNRRILSVIKFDEDGNLLSNKEFAHTNPNQIFSIHQLHDGNFGIVAISEGDISESEIYFFNKEFEFMSALRFDLDIYDMHYDEQSEQILILAEGEIIRSAHVISLSKTFNILWTRSLNTPTFTPNSNCMEITSLGITIRTQDEEFNSDVFTLMSFTGEYVGFWRLPRQFFFLNLPMSSNDSNIVYYAFASSLETSESTSFVAFHDPEFNNFGCYLPTTCLELEEFEVNITPISNPFSAISLNINIEDTGYITRDNEMGGSQDFCPDNFTPIAVPLFSSIDTICIDETVPLINLQNVNAESVQWDIPRSSLEFSELKEPEFSYAEPGEYTITQTVEYAGCFSDFEVVIVVVAPGEVILETAQFICGDEVLNLDVEQSFQADYLWLADSSTLSSIDIDTSGLYTLEIAERHCVQRFDIQVEDFDFNLIEVPLDPDTIICTQRPVEVDPMIDPAASFEWSDGFLDLQRNISESGFYTLTTSLSGCSTTSSIQVVAGDCSTQLYIPNTFSPNLDGINEDFFPLGNFFEVESFQVFDRWGTLVHDNPVDPWSGKYRRQDLPLGVYVYSLQIKNILLDEIELLKGDVLLIR